MECSEPEVLLYWFLERADGTNLQLTVYPDRTAEIFSLSHVPRILGRPVDPFENLCFSLGGISPISKRIYDECSLTVDVPDNIWTIVSTAAAVSNVLPEDDETPLLEPAEDLEVAAFMLSKWLAIYPPSEAVRPPN